jgi:hypothetical protein
MPRDTGGIGFGHGPHIRSQRRLQHRRRHSGREGGFDGIEEHVDIKYIALIK